MIYTAYTDGACRVSNPGPTSCAFVVYRDNVEYFSDSFFLGTATNNFSEYMGFIKLLEWAEKENIRGITVYSDSQLIVKQVNCEWGVKPEMRYLCARAFALKSIGEHTLLWVRGHDGNVGNERADQLCNEALDRAGIPPPYKAGKRKKNA